MNHYLFNLSETDFAALSRGEHYRIDSSRRVLRFALNSYGVAELAENVLGGIETLTRRCKARKRAENARKRAAAEKIAADWRAIIAARGK